MTIAVVFVSKSSTQNVEGINVNDCQVIQSDKQSARAESDKSVHINIHSKKVSNVEQQIDIQTNTNTAATCIDLDIDNCSDLNSSLDTSCHENSNIYEAIGEWSLRQHKPLDNLIRMLKSITQ